MRSSIARRLRCTASCCDSASTSTLARLRQSSLRSRIEISPEVQDALHRSFPVVSLETAITSHGLPYEQAVSSAKSLNAIIRERGAVPAPIGIIDGIIKIGLSDEEVQRLAQPLPSTASRLKWKVGRRDIAPALVRRVDGGTTVSGTSFLSHLAGIDVFVTGGIGGVHRGAQETMDISSDLTELGKTPVAVVCAGAKSILDIGLTLEYLETLGVTVATFGQTDDFPAFYSRTSGYKAPFNVRTAREAAELIYFSRELSTNTGALIGVPIPQEYEEKSKSIQNVVEQAVRESIENGISKKGKEVTPWILARVKELSGGESVESNIALIENNAKAGAAIAVELAKLKAQPSEEPSNQNIKLFAAPSLAGINTAPTAIDNHNTEAPSASEKNGHSRHAPVVVVGAAAIDVVSRMQERAIKTTSPGSVSMTVGGVARNVFEAVFKMGIKDALLISPVAKGSDAMASILQQSLQHMGARTDGLLSMEGRTPCVNMILDAQGDLVSGVADTLLVEEMTGDQIVEQLRDRTARLVCFDGNISIPTMSAIIIYCREAKISTVFEPTSNAKALRLLEAIPYEYEGPYLDFMAPNIHELQVLFDRLQQMELSERSSWYRDSLLAVPENNATQTSVPFITSDICRNRLRTNLPSWLTEEGIIQQSLQILPLASTLFVKLGSRGCLALTTQPITKQSKNSWADLSAGEQRSQQAVVGMGRKGLVIVKYYPALALDRLVSAVGGGDTMLGAIIAGLARSDPDASLTPERLDKVVSLGQSAAVATLSSSEAVGDLTLVNKALQDSK